MTPRYEWVSVSEASRRLNRSVSTIRRQIESGELIGEREPLAKGSPRDRYRVRLDVPAAPEPTHLDVSPSESPDAPSGITDAPAAITGLLELIAADRATIAGLYADTRALAESAAIWQERAIAADRRADQAERERAAAEAELARARRSWLDRLLGRYPAP